MFFSKETEYWGRGEGGRKPRYQIYQKVRKKLQTNDWNEPWGLFLDFNYPSYCLSPQLIKKHESASGIPERGDAGSCFSSSLDDK